MDESASKDKIQDWVQEVNGAATCAESNCS